MARMNDVGGMEGFGPVAVTGDEPAFTADWEARVFALVSVLLREGVFELDELRDAIERMPPAAYLAASYYERWFHAATTLLVEKGVARPEELEVADD
jgi:nitrile hydratase